MFSVYIKCVCNRLPMEIPFLNFPFFPLLCMVDPSIQINVGSVLCGHFSELNTFLRIFKINVFTCMIAPPAMQSLCSYQLEAASLTSFSRTVAAVVSQLLHQAHPHHKSAGCGMLCIIKLHHSLIQTQSLNLPSETPFFFLKTNALIVVTAGAGGC